MKRKPLLSLPLAVGLCAVAVSFAHAEQVFSDRAAFLTATSADVVIDFESTPAGPVVGDPWLPQGVAFDEAGVGDNMAVGDGNGADFNIYAAGGQDADIDLTLGSGIYAFGLAIFSNNIQMAGEKIVFYGASDAVLADVEMPLTTFSGSAFVGFIADEPIVRIAFVESDVDGDWVGIGEVVFRNGPLVGVEVLSWGQIKASYR